MVFTAKGLLEAAIENKMCQSKYLIKKYIFDVHKYFDRFTQPSTVCVDKALYKKLKYAAEIKNLLNEMTK